MTFFSRRPLFSGATRTTPGITIEEIKTTYKGLRLELQLEMCRPELRYGYVLFLQQAIRKMEELMPSLREEDV